MKYEMIVWFLFLENIFEIYSILFFLIISPCITNMFKSGNIILKRILMECLIYEICPISYWLFSFNQQKL